MTAPDAWWKHCFSLQLYRAGRPPSSHSALFQLYSPSESFRSLHRQRDCGPPEATLRCVIDQPLPQEISGTGFKVFPMNVSDYFPNEDDSLGGENISARRRRICMYFWGPNWLLGLDWWDNYLFTYLLYKYVPWEVYFMLLVLQVTFIFIWGCREERRNWQWPTIFFQKLSTIFLS